MTGESWDDGSLDRAALERARDKLAELDPRLAQLVELRCSAGLSLSEAARVLDIPEHRLERQWKMVRLWLSKELS